MLSYLEKWRETYIRKCMSTRRCLKKIKKESQQSIGLRYVCIFQDYIPHSHSILSSVVEAIDYSIIVGDMLSAVSNSGKQVPS